MEPPMTQPIDTSMIGDGAYFCIADPHPCSLTFHLGPKGEFSIVGTDTGFDIQIPEGVTMTECFEAFVNGLREHMKELKL